MAIRVIKAEDDQVLEKIFAVRRRVFVEEQRVTPEDEFDEFENTAHHVGAFDQSVCVGTARWRATDKGIKLERFAVDKAHRNKGIGSLLVEAVLSDIAKHHENGQYLYLHAQLDAIPLYEKFNFEKVGNMFEECNIKHFKMQRLL